MKIERLDHLVMTVTDIDITCDFYKRVLGMQVVLFGNGRYSLQFGQQKINLHQHGNEFEPKALAPAPGTADLCFITEDSIIDVINHLKKEGVELLEGPVRRTGALGPIESVYMRDPDGNLIEVSTYLE